MGARAAGARSSWCCATSSGLTEPRGSAVRGASCTTRSSELESGLGARVRSSFEHEFQLLPAPGSDRQTAALPFSLEAQRRAEPFAANAIGALAEADLEPERFIAEYAEHQFEIPVAPTDGVAGADRAVLLREIVREVARREGTRASFAPLLDPAQAGNGVHIHFNLLDASGRSLLYDADAPAGLSELGGRFAAGVLRHASALSALSPPPARSPARACSRTAGVPGQSAWRSRTARRCCACRRC